MCNNRIEVLQKEKRKLNEKSSSVTDAIDKKTANKNRAEADLTWKKKEIEFVNTTITDFRKELQQREVDVAEHTRQQRESILAATKEVGNEMRATQGHREKTLTAISTFDLAERKRRNQESTKMQNTTLATIFDSINMEKTINGVKRREDRVKNTETCETVALAELKRLQTISETVKKEQELSALRLKEKTEATQKKL